ncbi:hypothetical protein [Methanolobus sp.]|uniref:hypothetical protein n=1 Tax=Methanolobus sp. TaxID=1874737 RepID=UPI0025E6ACAA|nr:hypothetical protein [Methanolobus sp.]
MRPLLKNEEGVSVIVEYILLTLICIGFFMVITVNSYDIFLQRPNSVVVEDQFSDIGNMMSTVITDMYLILPANGMMEMEYRIPDKAGQETYYINADINLDDGPEDQIIEVGSYSSGQKVRVTIGGIAATMPINGTVSSSSTHRVISYDSTR